MRLLVRKRSTFYLTDGMNRLKEQRISLGLKQREVAERIGISQSEYQAYEADKRVPNARFAIRFADALETTVEELWRG